MDASSAIPQPNTNYFTLSELASHLNDKTFQSLSEQTKPSDPWKDVNEFRKIVLPALNQGLYEIISPSLKEHYPALEIGSGIGYSLHESLSSRTLRIQPSSKECQLLKSTLSDPIYQLNIEDLSTRLQAFQKKIPLFFALNVFDTMTSDERVKNLAYLSTLQGKGDRVIIVLDTNPYIDTLLKELKKIHPNHIALPFFPRPGETCKQSVILIPSNNLNEGPTVSEWLQLFHQECHNVARGITSQFQHQLHQIREVDKLQVIALEDFIIERITNDLVSAGYTPTVRYHASFASGPLPQGINVQQDLVYKAVTDTATIRAWSVDDVKFKNYLTTKELSLPNSLDSKQLQELRDKGHKVMGSEFLVIEGIYSASI